jgi:hypothetical protein
MIQNDRLMFNNSHLRFDYDSKVTSHSKCHLQFGGINNFRLTSKFIVSPFCFFHKIINDFFKKDFQHDFINFANHSRNNKIYFEEETDIFFIKD